MDKVLIACDHGGYELKKKIIDFLTERGIVVEDFGSEGTEIVRYPYYAVPLCEKISQGKIKRGILICSTGIGISIIANRHPHVRASLCTSTYMAKMTRKHNDSNVLCLGGKITGELEALDIVETWLNTDFEGGRHSISLRLLEEVEDTMFSGKYWHVPKREEWL